MTVPQCAPRSPGRGQGPAEVHPGAGSDSPGDVLKKYNDIVKSQEDKREYRGLQLPNRLKVLLVSDPTTDKSAAALDVNVGYLSDPDELPGLAHFCEHMLFLGTEKYPEENEYNKFLSEHGGSSNASTSSDHTTYYFDVLPQHLAGALDIFAQFFIAPLFSAAATGRELSAVNSEHEKNASSDMWRLDQLNKSTARADHPFHKFGTGTSCDPCRLQVGGRHVPRAVNSEHEKNASSDMWRLDQLNKSTARADHPFHKFGTGTSCDPCRLQVGGRHVPRAVNSEHEKNASSDMWRLDQLNKSTARADHPFHKFGTGTSCDPCRLQVGGRHVPRAVNSEHEKNASSDMWRLDQLNKSTARADHPFHKFGTGTSCDPCRLQVGGRHVPRAVNSEHEKNASSDMWRLDQLNKSTARADHPFHKFGTGTSCDPCRLQVGGRHVPRAVNSDY